MPAPFPLERYLNVRSACNPTFSPDGRFVAFLSNTTGVAQVWQVPVEGGWPEQLTFTGETVGSVHYHPHRHELIYGMDTGGNEKRQLYQLHVSCIVPQMQGRRDKAGHDGSCMIQNDREPLSVAGTGPVNNKEHHVPVFADGRRRASAGSTPAV
jgi:hypothetical protein